MLIFVIELSHQPKDRYPISTTPSLSSTSVTFFLSKNARAGIDVTEGSTRMWDTSSGTVAPPFPVLTKTSASAALVMGRAVGR